MSEQSQSLVGFRIRVTDVVQRNAKPLYRVRVLSERDGEWETVGFLELEYEEWHRFQACVLAHGGSNERIPEATRT